MFAACFGRM